MPVWLIVILTAAAVGAVIFWAESRATIIIAELVAIRKNLDKLRMLAEDDAVAETEEVDVEA